MTEPGTGVYKDKIYLNPDIYFSKIKNLLPQALKDTISFSCISII
jgi:hypothetical protein